MKLIKRAWLNIQKNWPEFSLWQKALWILLFPVMFLVVLVTVSQYDRSAEIMAEYNEYNEKKGKGQ